MSHHVLMKRNDIAREYVEVIANPSLLTDILTHDHHHISSDSLLLPVYHILCIYTGSGDWVYTSITGLIIVFGGLWNFGLHSILLYTTGRVDLGQFSSRLVSIPFCFNSDSCLVEPY